MTGRDLGRHRSSSGLSHRLPHGIGGGFFPFTMVFVIPRASWPWATATTLLSGIIAFPLLVRLTSAGVETDILKHAELAREIVASGNLISYSLWYPLIFAASGGGESVFLARAASVILLTGFVAAQGLVAFVIARRYLESDGVTMLAAMSTVVVTPLVNPQFPQDVYLGQFSATVWHNSTTIMAAPFVLIAFAAALRMLEHLTLKNSALFGIAVLASVLAKPNFAIAFLPVAGIALVLALARSRTHWRTSLSFIAVAFVPVTLLLIVQYVAVYGQGGARQAPLLIEPFAVWNLHSDNLVLSVVLSLAGPAAVLALAHVVPETYRALTLGWCTVGVAILQAILLAEEAVPGVVAGSANWFWGAHSAVLPLFLYSFIAVLVAAPRAVRQPGVGVAAFIAGSLLLAHVASGVYYALSIGTPGWRY